MKKILVSLSLVFCLALILSGCMIFVPAKYREGVEIPKDYPDNDLAIYDDAIVFEAEEDRDEITISYGTEDDLDDVIEFYTELFESVYLICEECDEGRKDYTAEGIGSCYTFEIEASPAKDKLEKHFDTVVEVTIEFDDDRVDLMESMQGFWLHTGQAGLIFEDLRRFGSGIKITDNSYEAYMDFEPVLKETGVFFLGNGDIITKGEGGITDPYNIVFENIYNVDVLTIYSKLGEPQHYIQASNDEIEYYTKINNTWQNMRGFWNRVGTNKVMHTEPDGFAYHFDEFQLTVYTDFEIAEDEIMYSYLDEDTITHSMGGETLEADIIFETLDNREVMTIKYGPGTMHFEKTTYEEFIELKALIGKETLAKMQGLWHYVGTDGKLSDTTKEIGFAYEYIDRTFNIYNDFEMTVEGKEFTFTDKDSIEYTQSNGTVENVDISFETIDGTDVLTYTNTINSYHFVKTTLEEFMAQKKVVGAETLAKLQGLWYMVGLNGEITSTQKNAGFAYEYAGNTFYSYSNFERVNVGVEFNFIDENTYSYMGTNGVSYTVGIKFETIEGQDVMTYTYNANDFHFIKMPVKDFLLIDDSLEFRLQGFWFMIGMDGTLSAEVKNQGNAVLFKNEKVYTYMNFELSYDNADYEFIDKDTIEYDLGAGRLKVDVKFKVVEDINVLCATILGTEYYFVKTTYDDYIAYRDSIS